DCGDGPGCLVAEPRRELGGLQVLAPAEHRLGAIQPDRLDADLDLALAWRRHVQLLKLEDFRPAGRVESHDFRHGCLLKVPARLGSFPAFYECGKSYSRAFTPKPTRCGACAHSVTAGLNGSRTHCRPSLRGRPQECAGRRLAPTFLRALAIRAGRGQEL